MTAKIALENAFTENEGDDSPDVVAFPTFLRARASTFSLLHKSLVGKVGDPSISVVTLPSPEMGTFTI